MTMTTTVDDNTPSRYGDVADADEHPCALSPDGYHLARGGRWDPYAVEPDQIDDH